MNGEEPTLVIESLSSLDGEKLPSFLGMVGRAAHNANVLRCWDSRVWPIWI